MSRDFNSKVVLTNHLLSALPRAEFERIAQYLHPHKLTKGSVLYNTGGEVHRAYFVVTKHVVGRLAVLQ